MSTHPYHPVDSNIADYTENELGVFALLGVFSGACVLLFSSTYIVSKRVQPTLSTDELLATMWFVLSGTIHVFFEGYFVMNYPALASKQTVIAQLWKEYALSDSRYLTQSTFVLCVESITVVVWGPLCMLVATLIVKRHPLRYPLQMAVSIGHFYGDVLYYATASLDHYVNEISYSRPEAFYFWVYFVLMNSFWILIPGLLIYQSAMRSANAIETVERLNMGKKSR